MKKNKRAWNLFCLVTALCVFGAVMTEARLPQGLILPRSVAEKNRHVLTDVKRRPDLAFFWMLSQKANQPQSGLSNEQKARIHEEFRRLFVQVIATEQKALHEKPEIAFSTSQKLGQILAEHRLAIRNIFTPEQRRKHRSRKTAGKLTGKLQTAAEFPQNTLSEFKLAKMSSHTAEPIPGLTPPFLGAFPAQTQTAELFERDVYQLQILRL